MTFLQDLQVRDLYDRIIEAPAQAIPSIPTREEEVAELQDIIDEENILRQEEFLQAVA